MTAIRKTKPLRNVGNRPKLLSNRDSRATSGAATKGTNMRTTETATSKPAAAKNGTVSSTAPETTNATPDASKANEAATDGAETTEKRRRGIVPTMPECIVFRLNGKVHAVIHNPVDGTSYAETGKGEGSAKGALEDSGFRLGMLYSDGQAWIADKLPAGAELVGYCSIKGFPLPKQS